MPLLSVSPSTDTANPFRAGASHQSTVVLDCNRVTHCYTICHILRKEDTKVPSKRDRVINFEIEGVDLVCETCSICSNLNI